MAFIFTTSSLLINHSHFLIRLLCLEGIILSLVLLIPTSLYIVSSSYSSIRLIILRFGACEASIGLRIMVIISRQYGSDKIKNLSLNKC